MFGMDFSNMPLFKFGAYDYNPNDTLYVWVQYTQLNDVTPQIWAYEWAEVLSRVPV